MKPTLKNMFVLFLAVLLLQGFLPLQTAEDMACCKAMRTMCCCNKIMVDDNTTCCKKADDVKLPKHHDDTTAPQNQHNENKHEHKAEFHEIEDAQDQFAQTTNYAQLLHILSSKIYTNHIFLQNASFLI